MTSVIPALNWKRGSIPFKYWIPAFAGMTKHFWNTIDYCHPGIATAISGIQALYSRCNECLTRVL